MGKTAIISIIVAVIIIAGGVFALTHKSNKSNTTTSKTSNSQSTSNTSSGNGSNMNMSQSSNSSNSSTPTSTDQVSIKDFSFTPASIKVAKGTKVTWTNNDSTAHTVTADSGSGPNSGTLNPGDSYSFTFNDAGTFAYHCNFHSSMHGTVTVE